MRETELEKIVIPTFECIQKQSVEKFNVRKHNVERLSHKYHNKTSHNDVEHLVYLPWFCGSDNKFLELLRSPHFFYQCKHNGLLTEYVVTPFFHTVPKHTKSCKDPVVCKHTFNYMVNFLMLSDDEQFEEIGQLIDDNFYSDRLQFLWLKSENEDKRHICTVYSSQAIKLNADGYFDIDSEPKYLINEHSGMEKLVGNSFAIFSKMMGLFDEGVARKDLIRNLGSDFGAIFKYILTENHLKQK